MNDGRKVSLVCICAVWSIGLTTLAGWQLDVELLNSGLISSGWNPLDPLTAIGFILSATALWLQLRSSGWRCRISRLVGAVVVAIGALKLFGDATGYYFGLDQLLFADRLAANSIAPNTAAGFVLVGLALVLVDVRLRSWLFASEALALGAAILGGLCIVGDLVNARAMHGVGLHLPMAAIAAVTFELLALGILFSRADRGIIAVVRSRGMGRIAARQ